MKLPSIRLPFLKRQPKAADREGGGDPLDDAPAKRPAAASDGRIGRLLIGIATGVLAVAVIGGTGALVGWLLVNAETTESRQVLRRPQLTVPVLAEGETPTANSSDGGQPVTAGPHTEKDGHAGSAATNSPAPTGDTAAPAPVPEVVSVDGVRLAAVDPTLLETKDSAKLPIIGPDGRQPWSTYARPFNLDDSRPRVAIVMIGVGFGKDITEKATTLLPGAISLSFSPYVRNIEALMARARQAGHETLIDLPMEPLDFPRDDPGPSTLLTSLSLVDNLNRLEWVLGRAPGYVGVTTWMGSQFTTVEDALMPVLQGLRQRGLMFVDSRASSRSIATELASSIQLPRAFNNTFIDQTPSAGTIDRALASLEATARQQRYAVGIARPLPVTIERLSRWAGTLEGKGIALAPISAIADRQRLR
ncbi:hypothetical protein BAL199_15813 [alpha proteobacterium BAL199]|nr:hypothetical protein BAL199_15813 [alpha proteobacterium BAL199]